MSLKFETGRVLILYGASGSGKTTLLKIMAGRESPTPGNAKVGLDGRPSLIYPFDQSSLWERIFAKGPRTSSDRSALFEVVDRATDILFLDDPLAGQDILERERILSKIKKSTADKQITVVYATSDFETAALVGDEMAVLEAGAIGQTGSPDAIYETPRTRYIASITGRCNIFEARRLTSSKSEIPEFQTIKGDHRLFAEKADIAKLGSINRNIPLAIRPENISISFGASFPADNLLRAVVTGIRYLGTTTAIEFDCSGLTLDAIVFRLVGLNLGDECMLGLPPERIRILKD